MQNDRKYGKIDKEKMLGVFKNMVKN